LSAFSDALRLWRRDDNEAGEDGSVRNKESEADAVQIMTMHAAKGLEFNAVFVPYGFTQVVRQSTPKEEKPGEEMEARRLLYVALTRAKYKLYLPWARRAAGTGSWKKNSALNTFLGRGILALYADANDRVKGADKLPEKQDKAKEECCLLDDSSKNCVCPDLPPHRGMKGWRFKWDSFSSLNHHSAKKPIEPEGQKLMPDEGQNNAVNEKPEEEPKQKALVPKGALSGTVFHEVMEALCKNSKDKGEVGFEIGKENDFEKLVTEADDKKSPLLELVRRRLAANGVVNQVRKEDGETTASVIARMAWNALRTKLDFEGVKPFSLWEIPLEDRKAEVNFVLDESLLGDARKEGAGALNGSIDLLVRRDDGYYIVDWKTNSLDDYEYTTVTAAMKEAGYDLQYKIYTLAAEKWLGENTVKGIAYLFVRGGEVGEHPSGKFVQPMSDDKRAKFVGEFAKKVADTDKNDADNEEEDQ
jgi:exodeoxyribonuclease V beta subunit